MAASALITAPATEPVTITETKTHLRVSGTDLDAAIARQIVAARYYVEGATRRALISQTWDFKYDWDWPTWGSDTRIDLPLQPVSSITSITYVDDAGATQTLASNQYQVVGAAADSLCYIVPAYGVSWPSVRYQPAAIIVRAVCGYGSGTSSVPEPLRQAVLLSVELLHDREPTARDTLERARDTLLDHFRVVRV